MRNGRTVLSPVQADGVWCVQITWANESKRLFGKFGTKQEAEKWIAEAKKAAEVMFDKLDRDHDGTLTRRELRGRLSAKEFAVADTDKDGTISKDEYFAIVEQRFKAADTANDGTLTRRELRSKAGRQLLLLLR